VAVTGAEPLIGTADARQTRLFGNRWLPQNGFHSIRDGTLSCHPPNGVCVVLPSPNIFLDGHIFLDNRCGSFGSGAICTVHGPRQQQETVVRA